MHSFQRLPQRSTRRGFTLIEMMVVIGLATLMMSMFTVIFGIAAGTVSEQRGIAHNDQKARTLATIIRNDLKYRTFRSVIAFAPGEDPNSLGQDPDPTTPENELNFALREGYFYISENDPDNGLDDVLQFTVKLPARDDPFYGKAQPVGIPRRAPSYQNGTDYGPGQAAGQWVQPAAGQINNLVYYAEVPGTSGPGPGEPAWPVVAGGSVMDNGITWRAYQAIDNRNQPEYDDGEDGNGTGASTYATVCYFVRGGRLYRRVFLIRQPLDSSFSEQPQHPTSGADWFANFYRGPSFWNDFDYAAFPGPGGNRPARFHGVGSLNNDINQTMTPLAIPRYRFGHNIADGQPFEFLGVNGSYLGRYTHQETSDTQFEYPHSYPNGNPFDRGNAMGLTYDAGRSVVVPFDNGSRRAEDILLTGVLKFDIEVWDAGPGANAFVDIGGTGAVHYSGNPAVAPLFLGNQHRAAALTYGPRAIAQNNIFDTWHPSYDHNADNNDDPAPYRPQQLVTPPLPNLPYTAPVRMRAIRLTIQYIDPGTEQVRQVTLVQSLMDNQPRP